VREARQGSLGVTKRSLRRILPEGFRYEGLDQKETGGGGRRGGQGTRKRQGGPQKLLMTKLLEDSTLTKRQGEGGENQGANLMKGKNRLPERESQREERGSYVPHRHKTWGVRVNTTAYRGA